MVHDRDKQRQATIVPSSATDGSKSDLEIQVLALMLMVMSAVLPFSFRRKGWL